MNKFKGFPSADKQTEMFFKDKNRRVSCKRQSAGSVSNFSELFSDVAETKDPLADPDCCMCEGRGFYKTLDVGEYDEQETTVQCSCKRKQNATELSEKVPSNRACSYSREPFYSNGLLARARRAAAIKPVEFTQLCRISAVPRYEVLR